MNKITATAGLVAFGAASVHGAVFAPNAGTPSATKPWSVSGTLRAFYDDNYTTSSKPNERDSFGVEVMPAASYNWVKDATTIGLSAVYSMRWFEDRKDDEVDHTIQLNGKLSHAFSNRFKLDVSESFVIAQEPQVLDPDGVIVTVPLRSDGDNIRNSASISLTSDITENFQLVSRYNNNYFDYDQDAADVRRDPLLGVGNPLGLNSRSSLLDRMEHKVSLDGRQVLLPQTVGVIGYAFQYVDYLSNDRFGGVDGGGVLRAYNSDIRNSMSHYFTLGVDQSITTTLNASLRAGVQYTKYDKLNDYIPAADDDDLTPYVDASATWAYMAGSYAQLGVRHSRSQTDIGFIPGGGLQPNLDAEATSVYGSINHRFYGSFVVSLIGQYQMSNLETGGGPDIDEDLFFVGVNLTYEINKWLAAEVGYNYDRLDSELSDRGLPRDYTRNRVYAGIRATY